MLLVSSAAESATRRVNQEYCATGAACWRNGVDPCSRTDLFYPTLAAADQCTETGDRLVIQCDAAPRASCDYANADFYGTAYGRTRTNVTVAAQPPRSVRFRRASFPSATDGGLMVDPVISVGVSADNWEFDGLVVDGRAEDIIAQSTASGRAVAYAQAAVLISSHGVNWRHGIIENSIRDCAQVHNNTFSPQGVTFEGNTIRRCIYWTDPAYTRQQNAQGEPLKYQPDGGAFYPDGGLRSDAYDDSSGIYTFTAADLVIKDNIIHHTSGDGVQLDINANTGEPGAWANVTITGNHIYTSPLPELNGTSPGENGVDAKPGVGPVMMRGNTVHGFRGFTYPFGKGTGSDHGAALLVHGRYTGCGTAIADGGVTPCAVIEGNDVSDSNFGIGVANNNSHLFAGVWGSAPIGVFVSRNVVHDMSSDASPLTIAQRRGGGIGAIVQDPGGGQYRYLEQIRFEHNTLANIPGMGIYESGDASWCRNSSCVSRYNLVSNAGELCGPGASALLRPTANLCTDSTPANGPGCTQSATTASFLTPLLYQQVSGCGENLAPPSLATGYDYSVGGGAAVENALSDQNGVYCGSRSELGAKETCGPMDAFSDGKMRFEADMTSGSLALGSVDYFRMQSSFTTGLGAFGNSLLFDSPALPGSRCHAGRGGSYNGCVFSTGGCESGCAPGRVNGELNCACIPTQSRSFGTPPPMATGLASAYLNIDWNGDGARDDTRYASAFADYLRLSELHGQLAFEDYVNPKGAGDRDDFIADVVAVECNSRGTSALARFAEQTKGPTCAVDAVCDACKSVPTPPLSVDAKILIDRTGNAENPPSEGRSLHVAVTVKSQLAAGEDLRYAVCPVLTFTNGRVVDISEYFYSTRRAAACERAATSAGQFECNVASPTTPLPGTIAFARFQSVADVVASKICSPQNEASDLQVLTGDMRCGGISVPTISTSNFRVRLADVDSVLGTAVLGMPVAYFEGELQELRLYVIAGIQGGEFFCPSGFNADVWKVDPTVGAVTMVRWTDVAPPRLSSILAERAP